MTLNLINLSSAFGTGQRFNELTAVLIDSINVTLNFVHIEIAVKSRKHILDASSKNNRQEVGKHSLAFKYKSRISN